MIRRFTPAILVVLLALVACSDLLEPVGNGDSVRLVVRPSFGLIPAAAQADNPASRVDNVHVVLRNAAGVIVVDQIIEWPLDQDTLRLELDVTVSGEEQFELTVEGRSGDQLLFVAGPMPLELSSGSGGGVETSPVLEYAGPGAEIEAVEIQGAPGAFIAGSTVGLEAVGANSDGSTVEDPIVVWTSLDPEAATVDDAGVVTVLHDASRTVSIEARIAFTTVTQVIEAPVRPAAIEVEPESAALHALGAELPLTATLRGADGGEVTGLGIEWSPTEGPIVEVSGSGGTATATAIANGGVWAIAEAGGLRDSSRVEVAQTVARVDVEPDEVKFDRSGETASAAAVAFDANDNLVGGVDIVWTSRASTVASVSGGTITAVGPGTAWIVASAGTAADSLLAAVRNVEPEVTITAPDDGAAFEDGDTIILAGTASDLEAGDLSGSMEWSSDVAGDLGTGAELAVELEPGDHVITAVIHDAHGDSASASVAVTVKLNTPPTVEITSPEGDATIKRGDTIELAAVASDPEDGNLSGTILWSVNDGEEEESFFQGASIEIPTGEVEPGTYVFTATVTDSRGAITSDGVTITIEESGYVIAGTVRSSGPVYEATVELYTADDFTIEEMDTGLEFGVSSISDGAESVVYGGFGGPDGAPIQSASTDTDGRFALDPVPAGQYIVSVVPPTEAGYIGRVSVSVSVPEEDVADLTLYLVEEIDLIAPEAGDTVTSTPELTWESIPAASRYEISFDNHDFMPLFQVSSSTSSYQVDDPLSPLTWYRWSVVAYDAEDNVVGLSRNSHSFRVNAAPEIDIAPNTLADMNPLSVVYGWEIDWVAAVNDEEDQTITGVNWLIDEDPSISGTGASFILQTHRLMLGNYTLRASVTDSDGATDEVTRQIHVTDPGLTITSPSNGDILAPGQEHVFTAGMVNVDGGDPVEIPPTRWRFDSTSFDSEGPSVQQVLAPGVYAIEARIANSNDATVTTDVITVRVTTPPVLTVDSIYGGELLNLPSHNYAVPTATAEDAEDGDISNRIKWFIRPVGESTFDQVTPDSDGIISFLTSDIYEIRVEVTDDHGVTTRVEYSVQFPS